MGSASREQKIVVMVSEAKAGFVRRMMDGVRPILNAAQREMEVVALAHLDGVVYHAAIESLASRPDVAGLLYGHLRLNVNQLSLFKRRGIPVAAVGERIQGTDWVTVDEEDGAYQATRYLLGQGHRQLALINGPMVAFQSREREAGFFRALRETGLDFDAEDGVRILHCSQEEGRDAAHMLLDLPRIPTAIFAAAGDTVALGVLAALRERGLNVPERMSLVGYDNLDFTNQVLPPLTTINQPLETMGALAAQRLLHALEHPEEHRPTGTTLEAGLVVRASVASPRIADSFSNIQ